MTASPATVTDVDVVRAVFGTFARGDLAALSDLLHADTTWHHHNEDRLGGIHRGADAIIAYLTESALLTAGTLHAEPQSVMADGQGHVAVPVRLSASTATCPWPSAITDCGSAASVPAVSSADSVR